MLSSSGLAFKLSLLLFGSIAAAQLNKPVAASEAALEEYYNTFWDLTSNVPATYTAWPAGTFPQSCQEQAINNGYTSSQVRAYAVTYSDCAEPWIICRIGNAALSLERQIRILGRVPVKSRVYLRHMMAFPTSTTNYAYTVGKDVAFFVDIPSFATMIHELTHVLDNGKSDGATWRNAVAGDTCVITAYANTNHAEAFASLAPLVLLHVLDQPAFMEASTTLGLSCLGKQYAYIHDKFDTIFTPGGSCPARVNPNSPTVTVPLTKRDTEALTAGFDAKNRRGRMAGYRVGGDVL